MHLTTSLTAGGFHPAGWRVCSAPGFPIQAMAATAERGGLDAVWLGPSPFRRLRDTGLVNFLAFDPLPLLGSLIAVTGRIGLGAVWSVDHSEPFNVARVFATLDHLANGRTAWIVPLQEELFGRAAPIDDAFHDRAGEFMDVVRKLWDSWEDEAFALDVASGMFADPARVHPVHHAGRFFAVRGPLNVPRPVQGNPVLVQIDGGTEAARALAAATAEVLLVSCGDGDEARRFYHDMKARVAAAGRDGAALRILVNVTPILHDSMQEAARMADALDALVAPVLAGLPERAPLRFVGTPETLVDLMARWTRGSCCDGFNLMPAVLPDDLSRFVDTVIPLARECGLRPHDYGGETLREHLGLRRPRSRYAA